jgi:phage terminase small subunit
VSLTVKQQSFLEHYLACWNASEAVRRMGYTGTRANRAGEDYLSKPDIQAAIKQRLTELQMSADEVLTRLTSHARSSMAPFIRRDTDGDLYGFDLSETQPLHLIKKASVTRRRQKDDKDDIITVETVTIELYDAQAALQLLGRHHKLFVDRTELTGKDGAPIEVTSTVMDEAAKELETWRKQMTDKLSSMPSAAPTPPTSSTDSA